MEKPLYAVTFLELHDVIDHIAPRRPMRMAKLASKTKFCAVVQCKGGDSENALTRTCESLLKQEVDCTAFQLELIIWCNNCSESTVGVARQFRPNQLAVTEVDTVKANCSFLGSLLSPLSTMQFGCSATSVLLCTCGMIFQDNFISFLLNKISEYGSDTVLTAFGIRIFPHEKLNSIEDFHEGKHWKMYGISQNDRAVHCFTTEFCCISTDTLKKVLPHCSAISLTPAQFNSLWCSFVIGHHLRFSVWQIRMEEVASFGKLQPLPFPSTESIDSFYSYIYTHDWPTGISKPIYISAALHHSFELPLCLWEKGFGGVNMSSEPSSELDFAAAAAYGIKVIRIGAVCDAKDLSYLLDPNSCTIEEDKAQLIRVLPRLRRAILQASFYGLKVIITMADVPGSNFHSREDSAPFPFWESVTCRVRAAKFWGIVAECLADMKHLIMGYDLINEPYMPEDRDANFFDDMPLMHQDVLHQFYQQALHEVRQHDSNTIVIVKGTWFASPRAINNLLPLPDSNVAYAFHMYAPPLLTLHRKHGSPSYSYPGPVPRWIHYATEKVYIDQQYLHDLLQDSVYKWQLKYDIPANRILVAEFGVCREVPGAAEYLRDVVSIFEEFRWSWLVFSFRDEEWDALDYELGSNLDNMLYRSATKLFMSVAQHFH